MAVAPLYRLIGVEKFHQGRPVLEIPALEIETGQVTVISGPNGAGKTTLLNLLAFITTPDKGRLEYEGQAVRNGPGLTALRREVTLVAQDAYLFNSSVAKNLLYGLELRGLESGRRESRTEEALRAVGLAGFAQRKARQLSSGESQRVALARALALKPKVMLLDEPFANLDPESEEVFERVIQELPAKGCTVVMVTHGRGQTKRLAQRGLRLEAGRLVLDADQAG
jgi:tungstate transport system ATP-binding protein